MDSETRPLLRDAEADADDAPAETVCFDGQHFCGIHVILRGGLIFDAIFICVCIFIYSVVDMVYSTSMVFRTGQIITLVWSALTIAVLAILVWAGRRPNSKLGRTVTQIRIFCALEVFWAVLSFGLIAQTLDGEVCQWYHCGWHTSVIISVLIMIPLLLGLTYATYRQAVRDHGTDLVPKTAMVPAWRLSHVAVKPTVVI